MEFRLSIQEKYVDAFLALIKRLKYVEIKEVIETKNVETKAAAWQRIAEDSDMQTLANEGLTDYNQIVNNYETT